MNDFNVNSADSIIEFAKKLKGKTLKEILDQEIKEHGYQGKGSFGQVLEKFYFGYEPNSNAEPDFKKAGLELKSSPLKVLKNGEYRSKERLVLNIINYLEVYKETFENSSFLNKNAYLLLVFYLYEKEKDILDYSIELIDGWKYPAEDLKIIKHDWEKINQKIKEGKAHELSEGDTFYLGACTKGSTAIKSLRNQPFNKEIKAKQRAYSLKQGYVNHIIANIAREEQIIYGKVMKKPEMLGGNESMEDLIVSMFEPFYGKTPKEIEVLFGLELNNHSKNYYANLTNKILGLELNQRIEEFEKADIHVRTIRLKENGLPEEDISFPAFDYKELVNIDWNNSDLKNILESKFFLVFYQLEKGHLILKKVKFWNMPQSDISIAKTVWDDTIEIISNGNIVRNISSSGRRSTNFPKKSERRICHVRPHARDTHDTFELPVKDNMTGVLSYMKHSFWLNASYVKSKIYEE